MRYNKLLCLIPLFCILFTIPLFSYSGEIDDINAAIKAKGAKWVAKENHIFLLSPEERRMRVGVIQDAAVLGQVVNETFYAPAAVPSSYDWRNVSGGNYVTPIRNQGNCGSCWAFAVTAALESNALITFDTPGVELNLSEQIVVSCSGAGSCSGGSPRTASNFLKNTGTNLESCYPYTATNGDCNLACANWQDGAYRIDGWSYVSSGSPPTADALKNAIYTNGPVVAVFDVYNDFFSYHSGVYSYVSGSLAGGHAVLIVGWDDDPPEHIPCFIVKNSWGAGWGESGYFRIAYTELTGTTDFASSSYAYGNAYQAVSELIPPETTITGGPSGTVTSSSAMLTFNFTGSDNVTPVSILVYATYLQGYDSGWSSFSSSNTKSYSNLPPGTYTFQVKAKDLAGNEDPSPATQTFTLLYAQGGVSYHINPNASYSYVNASNKITSWQGNANDGYFNLSLGDFDFQFYGISVNSVRVSTNGYVTFGTEGTKYTNDPIPTANPPNAVIAPFWDDLDLSGLGVNRGVRWGFLGTAPNRQLVLEWRQVPSHDYRNETYSFEIILYESIDRIKFQYQDIDSGTSHDRGASATVGIENFDGTKGAQFSFNGSTPLSNGLAIEFIPLSNQAIVELVTDYYLDILDRPPEPAEADGWIDEIERIVSLGIDIKEGFIALGKSFFNSAEYFSMGKTDVAYVTDLYETFFQRVPAQAEIDYWVGYLTQGMSRNILLYWFVYSEEFKLYMEGIFGVGAVRPENNLVNDFYRGVLGRLPDTVGFNEYLASMRAAQCSGAQQVRDLSHQIALEFTQSLEYVARGRTNSGYIEDLYDAILRRGALPPEVGYWETFLNMATRDQVLQFFTSSPEFQTRVQEVIDAGCLP